MNGKLLLDTNIVLGFLKGDEDIVACVGGVSSDNLYTSVITRMELLSFHGITQEEQLLIYDFLALLTVRPLDNDVERIAIHLRKVTRRKLPDAIVAASAIVAKATLLTCDLDLASTEYPGLRIHNPKIIE